MGGRGASRGGNRDAGIRANDRGRITHGFALVALGLVLAATGVLVPTYGDALTGEAVPVGAVVLESEVVERDGEYHASVLYRYEFDGTDYRSARLFEGGPRALTLAEARDLVERYPEGATVRAYVDRDAPWEAHLVDRGSSPLYDLFVGGGAVLALVGAAHVADQFLGIRGGAGG